LWHKSKNEVTDEELKEFYKFISNDFEDPLDHLHLAMEGRINFKALLFVPKKARPNFFRYEELKSVQLFSNKVFVQEDCKELIPEYLRFVEGVVDSEDLPLNVSREVTQYTPIMNKIKDVLVGKILGMIEYWAKEEEDKFKTFYSEFGSLFKSGLNSDFANRDRLTELLRFQTTKSSNDDLVSLSTYVERMPDYQQEIYYLTGENLKEMRKNPKLEFFKKKDVEVLLLSDPVDAFVVPGIFNYKEKPFKSIEKSDIDLPTDNDEEQEAVKGEDLASILDVFKKVVGEKVEDVVTSKRLVDSPVMLTIGKDGLDPHMERMMKMMDQGNAMPSKRVLEVNASHPLITNLNRLQSAGKTEIVEAIASQLYESSLLLEGNLESPGEFVNRLTKLLTDTTSTN
jgi:molecular chaperone HtpG